MGTFLWLGLVLALAAPAPVAAVDGANGETIGKDNPVLWIFPNYRTVDEEKSAPSIPPKDKLRLAIEDSFDPYAFPVAALFAGAAQAQDQYPSWGRGLNGYKNRYIGAFADQTISNFMSEAAFPIALRQDPRYLRLGRGGILRRLGYAVSRIFVARTDGGEAQLNYSEFGGNAVMAGVSNAYYPRQDRSAANTAAKFGFQIGFDLLGNVGKEFWPDVKQALTGRPSRDPG